MRIRGFSLKKTYQLVVLLFLVVALGIAMSQNTRVQRLFTRAAARVGQIVPQKPLPKLALVKSSFDLGEPIRLTLQGELVPLTIQIAPGGGTAIASQTVLRQAGSATYVEIETSKFDPPGRYQLRVLAGDTMLLEKEVYLGAVTANLSSARYSPGDTISSQVVLFDSAGNPACDPVLMLQVAPATGGAIQQYEADARATCSRLNPVHSLTLPAGPVGVYSVRVATGHAPQGSLDRFEVSTSGPVQVARSAPTVVRPDAEHDIRLSVIATADFTGVVSDLVPSSFQVSTSPSFDLRPPTATIQDPSTLRLRYPFDGEPNMTGGFGETPEEAHLNSANRSFEVKAHDGVDFGVAENTSIVAVDQGVVIEYPKKLSDYGTTIVLQHSWGRSFYGHLNSAKVRLGQTVKKGEIIGLSGNTGLSTGPHLHFGIELSGSDVNNGYLGKTDPAPYLSQRHNFADSRNRLEWNVSLKKGERVALGYRIKIPSLPDPWWLAGPVSMRRREGGLAYEESSPWVFVKVDR